MSFDAKKIAQKFRSRAAGFRKMADETTHPQVADSLRTVYLSFQQCADLVEQIANVPRPTQPAKQAQRVEKPEIYECEGVSILVGRLSPEQIEEAAELLASGKDAEAIKHIAFDLSKTALELALKYSGYESFKIAGEALADLAEVLRAKDAFKFRKRSGQIASDFFQWLQQTDLAASSWAYAAQGYLLDPSGKGTVSVQDVSVEHRKHRESIRDRWTNDPDTPKPKAKKRGA